METQSRQLGAGVVVITGGAGALAAAIPRCLARSRVVSAVWDIALGKASAVTAGPYGAGAYQVEVTDYAAAVRDFGIIDIPVNNASPIAPLDDYRHIWQSTSTRLRSRVAEAV